MRSSPHPEGLPWPELSDASAAALHDLLSDFLVVFESHYLGQIRRHHDPRTHGYPTQLSFLLEDPSPTEDPQTPPF